MIKLAKTAKKRSADITTGPTIMSIEHNGRGVSGSIVVVEYRGA